MNFIVRHRSGRVKDFIQSFSSFEELRIYVKEIKAGKDISISFTSENDEPVLTIEDYEGAQTEWSERVVARNSKAIEIKEKVVI